MRPQCVDDIGSCGPWNCAKHILGWLVRLSVRKISRLAQFIHHQLDAAWVGCKQVQNNGDIRVCGHVQLLRRARQRHAIAAGVYGNLCGLRHHAANVQRTSALQAGHLRRYLRQCRQDQACFWILRLGKQADQLVVAVGLGKHGCADAVNRLFTRLPIRINQSALLCLRHGAHELAHRLGGDAAVLGKLQGIQIDALRIVVGLLHRRQVQVAHGVGHVANVGCHLVGRHHAHQHRRAHAADHVGADAMQPVVDQLALVLGCSALAIRLLHSSNAPVSGNGSDALHILVAVIGVGSTVRAVGGQHVISLNHGVLDRDAPAIAGHGDILAAQLFGCHLAAGHHRGAVGKVAREAHPAVIRIAGDALHLRNARWVGSVAVLQHEDAARSFSCAGIGHACAARLWGIQGQAIRHRLIGRDSVDGTWCLNRIHGNHGRRGIGSICRVESQAFGRLRCVLWSVPAFQLLLAVQCNSTVWEYSHCAGVRAVAQLAQAQAQRL